MKKNLIIMLSSFALLAPIAQVSALDASKLNEMKSSAQTAVSENFDALKKAGLQLIDASIQRIQSAESKINASTYIESSTKQTLTASLNNTEAALNKYKKQLEAADSPEEVKAINQEVAQYLKDNKDVIRQNVQTAVISIGNTALKKAEALKQQVDQLLQIMKVTCPSEAETIAALESQLDELDKEIASLKSAVQTKDTAAIKSEVQKITILSQSLLRNAEQVAETCQK